MSLFENKNHIDNGKKEITLSEQKQKIKLSSNKLNTKTIFQNNTDIKIKQINTKINSIKDNNNNNKKQVFKKINLKIASQLISNANVVNLLKIKPSNKTESNFTIKAIKSSLTNKDKTFIPKKNNSNAKNIKNFTTITEPTTNINSNNKYNTINKSQSKKENPFNLNIFAQPVDPMTLEMERFKKMRIGEKNHTEKKLGLQRKIKSSNKIPKINTNKNLNDFRKSEDIGDKLNVYINKEKAIKESQNNYKSYIENININKGKTVENDKNVSKVVNSTKSYSNSYYINNKNLNTESDISNTNRQSIKEYESSNENIKETLRDRAKKITKEKETLKKALTSKISSSLGSIQKTSTQKRKKTKAKIADTKEKNKKNKFDNKRLSTDINMIKSYETIQSRTSHQNKKIFPVKTFRRNFNQKLKINNQKNKSFSNINTKNNDIIKKKFEFLLKNIDSKIKLNIKKLFFLQLKQYNLKNIKNEINLNKEENNKKNENVFFELNEKEKEKVKKNEINKEGFDIISQFYNKKVKNYKAFILSKLKDNVINNKKIESIKNIKNITNKNYILNIKFFFSSIKKYISFKNKQKSIKKFIIFFSKYYKPIISNTYFKLKNIIKTLKKFDATKKFNICLSNIVLKEKKKILLNLKNYFNKSKKKEAFVILQRIYMNKKNHLKNEIFNKMYMYYKKAKKIESINKIRNLIIKGRKEKIKKYIYIIKRISGYKNKLKSLKILSAFIKRKILSNRKMCYNIIKKYFFMKKKIEGFNRFNDIFIQKRISKLRTYFLELINNIKKMRINSGLKKINKLYFIKKEKLDKMIYNKFKQYYKAQIKKNKIKSLFKSFISKRTIINRKIVFENFKNYIKDMRKYQKKMKLKNSMHIDITNSFILEKTNIDHRQENINKKRNINIIENINKSKNNHIFIKNENEENSDDNEVWTTRIEKWDIIYNSDDSLYQKNENE